MDVGAENTVETPGREPLCTVKELLVFRVICIVYGSIIFSSDPEWVAWAAPMAFGGALYTADPPPASVHLASPQDVFPVAFFFGVLSLFALALVPLVVSRHHWPSRFKINPASTALFATICAVMRL